MARLLLPAPCYYLLSSVAFGAVFCLIPVTLYVHAGEAWNFSAVVVFKLAAGGLGLFLAASILLRLLAARYPRAAATAALGLFSLGLFALLAHVYAPIPIAPLDGADPAIEEPLIHSLVELALVLVVLALFFSLRRGRGVVMAVFCSALLWLTTFGYFIAAGLQDDWNILLAWRLASPAPEPAAASPAPRRALAASAGERPNVYHIVLDMMQTDAFLQVLERNSWHEEFNGFELFRNNIANYLVTVNSKASYLTGRLYDGGDLRDWRKSSWDGGVFEALEGAGYRISMYSPLERWNHPRTDSFVSNDDVYEARMGLKGSQAYDFFAIWLTSLAPNALTAEVLPLAERMSGPLFAAFGHSGRSGLHEQALSIRDGYTSYASVLLLQQLQLDEAARGDSGEFVYAHALLPHGPFVIDGRCRYVGRPGQRFRKVGARHAYLQQAECAAALVIRFLHELKESGRYEDSVIIIHADTGNGIVLSDRPTQKTVLGHSETKLLASVQALLMIKRPHNRGALRVDDKPSQLIDLFPTMLDILDLGPPAAELDGRSLYEAAPDEQHEARFSLDPDDAHGLNLVEVRIDDPLDIRNSSLTVLSNGPDPAARQE